MKSNDKITDYVNARKELYETLLPTGLLFQLNPDTIWTPWSIKKDFDMEKFYIYKKMYMDLNLGFDLLSPDSYLLCRNSVEFENLLYSKLETISENLSRYNIENVEEIQESISNFNLSKSKRLKIFKKIKKVYDKGDK